MAPLDRDTLEREVAEARRRGVDQDARRLLVWAWELLDGELMMSTAFGKSGMVILHMVKELIPELPVYFLDTGFHFQETLDYAEWIKREWRLDLRFHRPKLFGDAFRAEYGEALYETDPDLCCHKNKVEPFAELIERHQGWIAGIRRDQSSTRADAEPIEILAAGKLKVQPLVMWTRAMVEGYIAEHGIPLHPLFSRGYTSIGCAPCTSCVAGAGAEASADERAGRWAGKEKTECGLHLFWQNRKERPPGGKGSQAFSA
jgi:phosphoadenosine phosphosulfate reductase